MATSLDTYAPYDSGAGADVREDTWRAMMRHMRGSTFGDGVLRTASTALEVYADSTGLQVKVRTGEAWLRAAWGQSTAEKIQSLAAAHASLARKDRIILRNDFVLNRLEIDVLTGTAGAGVAPALTQTTAKWEIGLGIVDVPATDTSIDAAQVADNRTWIDGVAHRVVKSTDKTVTNSNVLSADAQLAALMSANATYAVESCLIYTATTTADVRLAMTGPSGATGQLTANGLVFGVGGISGDIELGIFPLATTLVVGGAGTSSKVCARMAGTVVTGETAGPLGVSVAQNVAEANNAVLYTGSWVRIERLA
ncbi:hypothetical protein NLX83_39490 [Allokutzneria sp. A3M-2-11 16]|uniref:hypothetical protein n=1 Tax=Allokutzneria sp. A3M-2-11 16 TaxID=2962043 RepID=UPI0020B7916F|nr:hypothetical protein [Allokutzneria sp. A3M-2-11 16]MCP3805368.1 hypothetical protein [Allokutzneria sp. A3M-2-11 16]